MGLTVAEREHQKFAEILSAFGFTDTEDVPLSAVLQAALTQQKWEIRDLKSKLEVASPAPRQEYDEPLGYDPIVKGAQIERALVVEFIRRDNHLEFLEDLAKQIENGDHMPAIPEAKETHETQADNVPALRRDLRRESPSADVSALEAAKLVASAATQQDTCLERWGRNDPPDGNWQWIQRSDGYWTPWHLAQAQVNRLTAKLEVASPAPRQETPKIVCLCGSTRFIEQFAILSWLLDRRGCIALSCTLLPMWY